MSTFLTTIEPANPGDLPAILNLLAQSGLPTEGLSNHLDTTLVAREGNKLVGSAALEVYGGAALLRSVAVEQRLRGHGLGHRLAQAALTYARTLDIKHIYLLTETAADFFPRFGFHPITRADVPLSIRQSVEFTTACPDTAVAMTTQLQQRPINNRKNQEPGTRNSELPPTPCKQDPQPPMTPRQ